MSADRIDGGASASPTHTTPLTARQQALTAALRCHYADDATRIERPHCQAMAVVCYGPIALCATCDKMRSAVGRTHPPRRLPGAELTALIDAFRTLAQAKTQVAAAIDLARGAGASWSHIGDAIGFNRQGAPQRWGHAGEPALTRSPSQTARR